MPMIRRVLTPKLSMKNILPLFLLAGAALFAGCATTPSASQIRVDRLMEVSPAPKAGPVPVFLGEDDVPGDFDELAELRLDGNAGFRQQAADAFAAKAAALGADAVIVNEPDRKITFSGGLQTESTVYSAVAILYVDE